MVQKRIFDIIFSFSMLVLLSWFILITVILSALDTGSAGIFRQVRIGRFGKPFIILKLRTIHPTTGKISALGRFFRKYKIDEFPQLVNVLLGDMSMVGPRPDVPGYYDRLHGESRKILLLRPGITGEASLKYYNEDELLTAQPSPVEYHDKHIYPDKLKINLKYYYNHSIIGDIRIIILTILPGNFRKRFNNFGNDF